MKLENQVVSCELAQKLKELGVKQESLFYYQRFKEDEKPVISLGKEFTHETVINVSAFTVAELGEMLSGHLQIDKARYSEDWSVYWTDMKSAPYRQNATTEADARAKMLIYLLENKLITL